MSEKPINTLAQWPKPCPLCGRRVLRKDSYAHPAPFTEIYHFDCIYPIHPQPTRTEVP